MLVLPYYIIIPYKKAKSESSVSKTKQEKLLEIEKNSNKVYEIKKRKLNVEFGG